MIGDGSRNLVASDFCNRLAAFGLYGHTGLFGQIAARGILAPVVTRLEHFLLNFECVSDPERDPASLRAVVNESGTPANSLRCMTPAPKVSEESGVSVKSKGS